MFKVYRQPRLRRLVTLKGGEADQTFTATFLLPSTPELTALDALSNGEEIRAWLKRYVVDLDDVTDLEDNPIPFSESLLDDVLLNPEAVTALMAQHREATLEAIRGNYNRLPAPGQTAA